MNKKNLLKLADYLENLPEDYEDFEMVDYLVGGDETKWETYALHNGGVGPTCGSAACAVGHGPSAGFLFNEDEFFNREIYIASRGYVNIKSPNWHRYAERVFCDESHHEEFSFMFGGHWTHFDNTPWGAAARIRLVCSDEGLPRGDYGEVIDHNPEVYAHHHKNNRPRPSIFARVLAYIKG